MQGSAPLPPVRGQSAPLPSGPARLGSTGQEGQLRADRPWKACQPDPTKRRAAREAAGQGRDPEPGEEALTPAER